MKKKCKLFLVIFSVFCISFSRNVYTKDIAEPTENVLTNLKNQVGNLLDNDDGKHRFIVELYDDSFNIFENVLRQLSVKNQSSYIKKKAQNRLSKQEVAIEKIEKHLNDEKGSSNSDVEIKPVSRFKSIANGFVLEINYDTAKEIASLNFVKGVYYDAEISKPVNEIKPLMSSSASMIGAGTSERRTYSGEGRVVAILDSGADFNHPDMKITDVSKARWNKESVSEKINSLGLKGRYYSDKIPYAYNYAEKNDEIIDKNSKTAMHGMHIAGTIAANGKVKGIIPEAQLLIMKVFDNEKGTTNVSTYVEALDDAVALGADSVNISIGSLEQGVNNVPLIMKNAIENAKKSGVAVVISAGNDTHFSKRQGTNPLVENPDWGAIATPSVTENSMSVASVDNLKKFVAIGGTIKTKEKTFSFEVLEPGDKLKTKETAFKYGTEVEYVDVGYGIDDSDYKENGKSKVEGKIALILRGYDKSKKELENSNVWYYNSKIKKAQENGAIAVIIGNHLNNNDGLHGMIQMSQIENDTVPAWSISHFSYLKLKENENKKITLSKNVNSDYPTGGELSEFSSWGPTAYLSIKPEITAPGGQIYSTLNADFKNVEGSYGYMSGTSMATPHVTAAYSAVYGELEKIGYKDVNKSWFVKNLLMSTAKPIRFLGNEELFYSPRGQGAGLLNIDDAVNKNFVYAVDNRSSSTFNQSKIEFKDLKNSNKLDFDINLNSISTNKVNTEYDVSVYLQTDDLDSEKKSVTLTPMSVLKFKNVKTVKLENGKANFKYSVDFSDEVSKLELSKKFPNGYFLDGYVIFKPKDKNFSEISLPFLAFKGDWETNPPIIEKFINDMDLANGEKPFWLKNSSDKDIIKSMVNIADKSKLHFTHFYSEKSDEFGKSEPVVLGYDFEATSQNRWDAEYIAKKIPNFISPNGDNNLDYLALRAVFLRPYTDLNISVKDGAGKIVFENNSSVREGSRTYSVPGKIDVKSQSVESWGWNGKDKNGITVQDGKYTVSVSTKIQDKSDAKAQVISKEVVVDTVSPKLTEIVDKEKEKYRTYRLSLKATDDNSKIKSVYMTYSYKNYNSINSDEIRTGVVSLDYNSATGVYEIPQSGKYFDYEPIENSEKIVIEDFAGNRGIYNFNDENLNNKVNVIRENKEDLQDIPNNNLKLVNLENHREYFDFDSLPNGNYEVKFVNNPNGYEYKFYVDDKQTNKISLNAEKQTAKLRIEFKKKNIENTGVVQVSVSNANLYTGSYKLFATKVGTEEKIYFDRVLSDVESAYELNLPEGKYKLDIEGTVDTMSFDGLGFVEVKSGQKIKKTLTFYTMTKENEVQIILDSGQKIDTVKELFGDDLRQNVSGYELLNPYKYFIIENLKTGEIFNDSYPVKQKFKNKVVEVGKVNLIEGQDGSFTAKIVIPMGNFKISFRGYDASKYDVFEDYMGNSLNSVTVSEKSKERGKISVNTIINGDFNNKPDVKYYLIDSAGHRLEDLEKVPFGKYKLYGQVNDNNWETEREYYEVSVATDEPKTEKKVNIDVRWFNKGADFKTQPTLKLKLSGNNGRIFDGLDVVFKNLETKKEITRKLDKLAFKDVFSIPYGKYQVEIKDLNKDYKYKITGNSSVTDNSSFEIKNLEEELTLEFIRTVKDNSVVFDNSLVINQKVKEEVVDDIISYSLENEKNKYESKNLKIQNVEAGEYTLRIKKNTTKYVALFDTIKVKIKAGENFTEVPLAKIAENIVFNNIGKVEKYGDIVAKYEAVYVKDDTKLVFKEGEFPAGVELTVNLKEVNSPYKLKHNESRKVILKGQDELKFEFVVEGVEEILNSLKNDIAKAEKIDLSLYTKDSADNLKKVISDSKELLKISDLDKEQIEKAIKNLEDAVRNLSKLSETQDDNIVTITDSDNLVSVSGKDLSRFELKVNVVENANVTSLSGKKFTLFDILFKDINTGKYVEISNGDYKVVLKKQHKKEVENVYYVAEDGNLTSIDFTQDENFVTFRTSHFSKYAIVYKTDEKIKGEFRADDSDIKTESKSNSKLVQTKIGVSSIFTTALFGGMALVINKKRK